MLFSPNFFIKKAIKKLNSLPKLFYLLLFAFGIKFKIT